MAKRESIYRDRRGRKARSPYAPAALDDELNTRSRLTGRDGFIVNADGRSGWARRFSDLVALYASDLGGIDELCQAQKAMVRRISLIQLELEFQEGKFAALREQGKEPSEWRLDLYRRMSETLRRLLESNALRQARPMRDVTPPTASEERARNTRRFIREIEHGEAA